MPTKAGADKDYSFGTKNHWRRWQWNRIRDQLSTNHSAPPLKDAVVCGLFGADGLDIQQAERRGFNRSNMIGIEKNPVAAAQLRKQGITVLPYDLWDVVSVDWSQNSPDVWLIDSCGGISSRPLNGATLLPHASKSHGVIAVNFLRGRDSAAAEIPEDMFRDLVASSESSGGDFDFHGLFEMLKVPQNWERNRGVWFWYEFGHYVTNLFDLMRKVNYFEPETCNGALKDCFPQLHEIAEHYFPANLEAWNKLGEPEEALDFVHAMLVYMATRPAFFSYRSGNRFYDSCVFMNPMNGERITSSIQEEHLLVGKKTEKKIKASYRAATAVRTRRKRMARR